MSLAFVLAGSMFLSGEDPPAVVPLDAPRGKVCRWQSEDGLPFEFRVPESWKSDGTGNLTLVLHGNGLDERWTFFNHPVKDFRPDDVVVSPDGTRYVESMKNDEFLGEKQDAARLHELIVQLKKWLNPGRVFLYGHSQGSFFVFFYAGEYPEEVDGVLGHASGMWNWTQQNKKGHHQAIALMHGTTDHIPYGQSWWARNSYQEKGYPRVHLRTLWDWGHPPNHFQASLCLAWCEGMVSDSAERVAVALDTLAEPKTPMGMDLAALYEVAARMATLQGASAAQRKRAADLAKTTDDFAEAIAEAIDKELGKKGKLDALLQAGRVEPALGLVVRAREELRGVPAWNAFLERHAKEIASADKAADKALGKFWNAVDKDPEDAARAALDLLDQGALHYDLPRILERTSALLLEPKGLRLPKKALARLEESITAYRSSRTKGFENYESRLGKVRW